MMTKRMVPSWQSTFSGISTMTSDANWWRRTEDWRCLWFLRGLSQIWWISVSLSYRYSNGNFQLFLLRKSFSSFCDWRRTVPSLSLSFLSKVKPAVVHFEPSSIYGSRSGYHELLLVTAADKGNNFHKTKLWKSGVVANVTMLARPEMAKPARDSSRYGAETRFTRVQEMKQARDPNKTSPYSTILHLQLLHHTPPPTPPYSTSNILVVFE